MIVGWQVAAFAVHDTGLFELEGNPLHSFAARYTDDNGDELLYFGSDRFDNSGDAVQGFWFLQDEVTPVGTNGGGFDGVHINGDLLILSDFSNGGDVSTINVYEWDDRCNREG